jgi:hypothetical protein
MIYIRFTIMLDPHLKCLWGVENYVGCEDYIRLAYEFDANVIIPILMLVFEILNCTIQECVAIVVWSYDFIEDDDNIFGVDTSVKNFMGNYCLGIILVQEVIYNSYYMGWSLNLVLDSWKIILKCWLPCKTNLESFEVMYWN